MLSGDLNGEKIQKGGVMCLYTALPWWLSGRESSGKAGDLGLIPGLERSPGEGNGNPL